MLIQLFSLTVSSNKGKASMSARRSTEEGVDVAGAVLGGAGAVPSILATMPNPPLTLVCVISTSWAVRKLYMAAAVKPSEPAA